MTNTHALILASELGKLPYLDMSNRYEKKLEIVVVDSYDETLRLFIRYVIDDEGGNHYNVYARDKNYTPKWHESDRFNYSWEVAEWVFQEYGERLNHRYTFIHHMSEEEYLVS